ncbi:MAG: GDP-mannose 4,6-dehydratase [Planctomycetaceae bacterium]|nr:GDP-mannose 4,6-dehydratase [Planctomycetaceae bacterium]
MDDELKSMRGQKVLITGGLGFIGSNLAHKCLELGAEVTVFDCLDPRSGGNLFNVHDIRGSIQLVHQDIQDFSSVCQHICDKNIIFNCAASTSHPFSMREPWIDSDVNSKGVVNLLEAIRRFNKQCCFIHLGTSTQLGKLQAAIADEKHPEFPTDIYSANKCVSEKYVLIYARCHQLNATVIRLSNVFGPRASIHSSDFTFNNYFIGLAFQNRDITVYGQGGQMRNVIYVDDAVAAIIMASQNAKANGETFFAVGDEHFSVAQIAEATVKHIGSGRVKYIEWPKSRKAIEVGDAIISNKKIKGFLEWQPIDTLESGLIKTKAFYEKCLAEYLG